MYDGKTFQSTAMDLLYRHSLMEKSKTAEKKRDKTDEIKKTIYSEKRHDEWCNQSPHSGADAERKNNPARCSDNLLVCNVLTGIGHAEWINRERKSTKEKAETIQMDRRC